MAIQALTLPPLRYALGPAALVTDRADVKCVAVLNPMRLLFKLLCLAL